MEEEMVSYKETYQAMEELVDEGLIKNIGVNNIGVAMLREILTYARIKPAVL
jgi:diketogulonate reductase-like aldo/keto reductase